MARELDEDQNEFVKTKTNEMEQLFMNRNTRKDRKEFIKYLLKDYQKEKEKEAK